MLPPFDTYRGRIDTGDRGKPPPNPILIAREVGEMLLNRWVFAAILIVGLAWGAYSVWPEPVVRAEMDYVTLQNTVIRGSVESMTISGDVATGRFHSTVPAAHGEVVGISEAVPSEVSIDDMYEANAFVAPVPEDSRDSFVDLVERQGIDLSIE